MAAAIKQHPERFEVATAAWTGGSEQMVDAVAAYFGLPAAAAADGEAGADQQAGAQQAGVAADRLPATATAT